jgi:hypothetical protein
MPGLVVNVGTGGKGIGLGHVFRGECTAGAPAPSPAASNADQAASFTGEDPVRHGGRSSAFAGRIEYAAVSDDASLIERPSPRRTRPVRLVVAIALVVLAYVGLLVLYAVSGHTRGIGTDEGPPPGGVRVELKPEDIDGAAERMTVGIDLSVDSSLVDEGALTLARSVTVVIDPSAGTRQVTFPAGQIPGVNGVQIVLDGDIRNWPLDSYRIRLLVGAYDGSPETGSVLDSTVSVDGEVQGWRIAVEPSADLTGFGFHVFDIDVRRSGDTLAFAGIMLLVLIALPLVAWFVAGWTYWGGRAVQPTLLSWMAAMLFATVPLRNFLPGSPPAGSWIDAVIVLWVIVGLVGALGVYVLAWWHQSRQPG